MHIDGPIQPCINQMAISNYDINGDVKQQWITMAAAAAKSTPPQINAMLRVVAYSLNENRMKRNKTKRTKEKKKTASTHWTKPTTLNPMQTPAISGWSMWTTKLEKPTKNYKRTRKKKYKQIKMHEYSTVHVSAVHRVAWAQSTNLSTYAFCFLLGVGGKH